MSKAGVTLTKIKKEIERPKIARNVIITGQPGVGKTIALKWLFLNTYVTSYTATISTEPIEGAYPGMSASAEIITETSGETLIVPVSAVQYEGDRAFVYLASDGVTAGAMLADGALDLDTLTKVTVTTGMSDGSYIAVTAEGLAAGDVIWVPERTSTATYTADDTATADYFITQGGMTMPGGTTGTFQPPSDMGSGNFQPPSGN